MKTKAADQGQKQPKPRSQDQTLTDQTPESKREKPKIAEVLEAHRGERHILAIHDFPDPDAIASAFAHQLISAEFEIEVDVFYGGEISHRQNIALVRLLGIDLTRYNPNSNLSGYDGAVFVDGQGTTCQEVLEAIEAAEIPPLIIVDHHEIQERLEPEFADIRRVGASATIYTGYLKAGLIEMDTAQKAHVAAATALMHGIMTDTHNFIEAQSEDFAAASFLSRYRDVGLLSQIMSQDRSRQVMEVIGQTLRDRITVESFSIAGIGYTRAENRDAIPQAADFLLTEENIHTAIVYGIVKDEDGEETLVGSLRTARLTIDPDQFIKNTFGQSENGRYYGGGKSLAGGFEIPVGFLSGEASEDYTKLKWQVFDQQIKQKIFARIGADPK